MMLLDTYRRLGSKATLHQEHADRVVAEAMPHAVAALGRPAGEGLPVRAARVGEEAARGGSLIPAWPIRQPDGSVVIEYVADWGALLAGWLTAVGQPQRRLALDLVDSRQRVWIGIANDVLQLFVVDPPGDSYSMIRHHALMLAAATTWLGPDAIRAWTNAHASAARGFLRRHSDQSLWTAIDATEQGLSALLLEQRSHKAAPHALAWLDADAAACARYVDYLAAASLGVAALLEALQSSGEAVDVWLTRTAADLHPDPAFNRRWIEDCARRLVAAAPMGV
jgi:hypothetical protein